MGSKTKKLTGVTSYFGLSYQCVGCSAKVEVEKAHVRVRHSSSCAHWENIKRKFPGLVQQIRMNRQENGIELL